MTLTPKEMREQRALFTQEQKRLDKEYAEMTNSILHFQHLFVDLEVALSALLHAVLNAQMSHIPYAIYYSPIGFHARADIVSNALLQCISENKPLELLKAPWVSIKEVMESLREIRNRLAHGSPLKIVVRNKTHLRLAPPAFDVLRVGQPLGRDRIPGLAASDVTMQAKRLARLLECVNSLHRVVEAHHKKDAALPEIFAELEEDLRDLGSP